MFCQVSEVSANGLLGTRWMGLCVLEARWGVSPLHALRGFWSPMATLLRRESPWGNYAAPLEAPHLLFLTVGWSLSPQNVNGVPTVTSPVKTANPQGKKQHRSQVMELTPLTLFPTLKALSFPRGTGLEVMRASGQCAVTRHSVHKHAWPACAMEVKRLTHS